MTQRSIVRGAALNLAARVLTVGLGLVILVTIARLGPAVQGAFALFVAVEAALLTLFSGLGLLLAREVSHRGAAPLPWLRRVVGAALGLGACAALVLAGVSHWAEVEPYRHLWLLALAAPFLLLVPTVSGLWLGQGRMLPLNAPQVAAPALVLAGLAALALKGGSGGPGASAVLPVLMLWVAAKSLVGVGTAAFALRDAAPAGVTPSPLWGEGRGEGPAEARRGRAGPHPSPLPEGEGVRPEAAAALRAHWRFIATIGATNLLSLLNYRATLFIVERQGGLAEAGVYSVAVQVAELLWLLSSAVTVSAYHRIGAPDAEQAARTTLGAVRINLAATLIAAPLLYAAAVWAVPAVLGPAYATALRPLALLLPGVAGYAAASSLSAYYTNHRGRPQWSAGIAGLSLALTLVIAAWAVPRFGAAGAALATSVAYGIAMAVALRLFLRDAGLPWAALWAKPPTRQSPAA